MWTPLYPTYLWVQAGCRGVGASCVGWCPLAALSVWASVRAGLRYGSCVSWEYGRDVSQYVLLIALDVNLNTADSTMYLIYPWSHSQDCRRNSLATSMSSNRIWMCNRTISFNSKRSDQSWSSSCQEWGFPTCVSDCLLSCSGELQH